MEAPNRSFRRAARLVSSPPLPVAVSRAPASFSPKREFNL
jgi:hypothetical protein